MGEIEGSHCGDHEEYHLLGCDTEYSSSSLLNFWRNVHHHRHGRNVGLKASPLATSTNKFVLGIHLGNEENINLFHFTN
jgi:hypothetical protein